MRGTSSNEQFRLMKNAGHEIRAIVPLAWVPPCIRHAGWLLRRAVPAIESDHGVEIAHPRYFSLGPIGRLPALLLLQRALYWNALRPFVASFEAGGGDIVHAHSCELPGCMLGRLRSAKLVISMHNWEQFNIPPASSAWNRMILDTLRRADAVVYVSSRLMQLGLEAAGPHNACVIPHGINVYDDLGACRAESFTISTAARLIDQKKIHVVIEAFAVFRREVPDARLVVVGDGPERFRLEEMSTRLGVREAVQFTGRLSHREVAARIAESHVFVLPSVREALGSVYFEAMSQGVPVVGSAGEGIADFIIDGENGFLVSPDEPGELVRVLRTLHQAPDLGHRVAEAGRACFERSGVRWEHSTSAHLALFERLIQTSRTSS